MVEITSVCLHSWLCHHQKLAHLNVIAFRSDIERMQKIGQHWAWRYDKQVTFIVIPRRKTPVTAGWKEGETRYYHWKNCMCIHTAGVWEDENGTIFLESSRVHDNAFPFFPSEDGRVAPQNTKADFVRWKIDPRQRTNTSILIHRWFWISHPSSPALTNDSWRAHTDTSGSTSLSPKIRLATKTYFIASTVSHDIIIPPAKPSSSTSAMIPWSRNQFSFRVTKEPRKATDMWWLW